MRKISDGTRRDDWESLKPTVENWGINDTVGKVCTNLTISSVKGKRKRKQEWICPIYEDWKNMLHRALNVNYHKKNPTYLGTKIQESWKYLSNFHKWVMSLPCKNFHLMDLDKDFLSGESKTYSENTCVYIPKNLNRFLSNRGGDRGDYMIGVFNFEGKQKPFRACCTDPFTNKNKYLGMYKTEMEAHLAWKAYKHSLALEYVKMGLDPRVEKVLLTKFSPESDLTHL